VSSAARRRGRTLTLALALTLALTLGAGACRGRTPAAAGPDVSPPPWDDREAAALQGVGKAIPDVSAVDTGVNVPDAEAALLDEALCRPACEHLFDLLAAEQRERLGDDPEALELFLTQLEELRTRRRESCIGECRRWADPAMVRCVESATDRASLDRCDF
jgi:hypothetical protein